MAPGGQDQLRCAEVVGREGADVAASGSINRYVAEIPAAR